MKKFTPRVYLNTAKNILYKAYRFMLRFMHNAFNTSLRTIKNTFYYLSWAILMHGKLVVNLVNAFLTKDKRRFGLIIIAKGGIPPRTRVGNGHVSTPLSLALRLTSGPCAITFVIVVLC